MSNPTREEWNKGIYTAFSAESLSNSFGKLCGKSDFPDKKTPF
jgi:hypothetical protein